MTVLYSPTSGYQSGLVHIVGGALTLFLLPSARLTCVRPSGSRVHIPRSETQSPVLHTRLISQREYAPPGPTFLSENV